MRLPDPIPVLDKNRAPMGPEMSSSTGAGVWRKAPMAFPDSSSVLDEFQSAKITDLYKLPLLNPTFPWKAPSLPTVRDLLLRLLRNGLGDPNLLKQVSLGRALPRRH